MINKNAEFNIECSGCHHKFSITIKQATENKKVICPNCKCLIEIRGDLDKKLKEIERSIKDFKIK